MNPMMDLESYDGPSHPDARLYDEVLKCLDQRFGVDYAHVHTTGFSAGAIMADMLGVVRGDQIAPIVSYSGGYLSNPANELPFTIIWPDPVLDNPYTQIIVHGGVTDNWGTGFIDPPARFNEFAANDWPMLNAVGHDIVLCNHNKGHTIPSGRRIQSTWTTYPMIWRSTARPRSPTSRGRFSTSIPA